MVTGWLASIAHMCRLALHVPSIYDAANGWQAPLGHSKLAVGNRNSNHILLWHMHSHKKQAL